MGSSLPKLINLDSFSGQKRKGGSGDQSGLDWQIDASRIWVSLVSTRTFGEVQCSNSGSSERQILTLTSKGGCITASGS